MAARSGQITITTAGTAVQGTDIDVDGVYLSGLDGNAGVVYVGSDGAGDVTSANGYELTSTKQVFLVCSNLKELWFDAASGNDGDKVCWIAVGQL